MAEPPGVFRLRSRCVDAAYNGNCAMSVRVTLKCHQTGCDEGVEARIVRKQLLIIDADAVNGR